MKAFIANKIEAMAAEITKEYKDLEKYESIYLEEVTKCCISIVQLMEDDVLQYKIKNTGGDVFNRKIIISKRDVEAIDQNILNERFENASKSFRGPKDIIKYVFTPIYLEEKKSVINKTFEKELEFESMIQVEYNAEFNELTGSLVINELVIYFNKEE